MNNDLKFLQGELLKTKEALKNTKATDYKRYATLYQTYVALVNAVAQTEAILKQQEEERRRKEEEEKILKEAEEQIKAENKQKGKKRQSKEV